MLDAYPSDLQEFVQQKIAAGEFKSADEFALRAAQLYREMDRRRAEIKQAIAEGVAQLDAGDYIELHGPDQLHEFFEDVKRRGREQLAKSAPQS